MKNIGYSLKQQAGAMLLEALVAILIFSLGVLAIVGMQAAAVNNSTESRYRSDATLLANQLIGQMWTGDRTLAALVANFEGGQGATDGPLYTAWVGNLSTPGTVQYALPVADPSTPAPYVKFGADSSVEIRVFWKAPSDTGSTPHKYTIVAQIK